MSLEGDAPVVAGFPHLCVNTGSLTFVSAGFNPGLCRKGSSYFIAKLSTITGRLEGEVVWQGQCAGSQEGLSLQIPGFLILILLSTEAPGIAEPVLG